MGASSGAVRGINSVVNIVVGTDTPVTTQILGMDDFDVPDQTRDNLDATHVNSPDDTEEAIRDIKKLVVWDLAHHYVPGSDMDVALTALDVSGEDFILEITPVGAATLRYNVYLNGYIPTGIGPRKIMMAKTTFTVKSKIAA